MEMKDFQMLKLIGRGSYGSVFVARNIYTNDLVAIKQIDKSPQAQYECSVLFHLSHRCILSPIGYYQDISQTQYFIVQQLCLTDLEKFYRKFPNDKNQLLLLYCDALLGIIYLHQNNIVHNDIKASNILIKAVKCADHKVRYRACLTDFGMSVKFSSGQKFKGMIGTPLYASPEVLEEDSHNEKVDSWAMGILLYFLMTGKYTVDISDPQALETLKQGIIPDLAVLPALPQRICRMLLQRDPAQRAELYEIARIPEVNRVCRTRVDKKTWNSTFGVVDEETMLQKVLNGELLVCNQKEVDEYKSILKKSLSFKDRMATIRK